METLYRKYRSQTFSELVGQTQVTQILRNAIRRGRLSHAYLFCGPRGTGKTSVARIFAKALSCLNPVDGDCCGVCTHCVQIATGNALDVQEIDAASKNKVDDIRELRDKVGYAPAQFPYKIYIIDEVHMVTTQGFNALLKTLEEPPAHVKFLLCTTEAHKLPVTILSRCIRLDFTRIALPELAHHLQWIAGQEGFALDEDAALELAALAEGSARDAISLLDQLTVYCEGAIARKDVRELFQLGDPDLVPSVVEAIRSGARRELLDTWERLAGQGADAGRFLLQIAEALKQRYLESSDVAWRRALECVWQGLNLLKQESFPALLVELALLQAADAYAAPEVQAVAATEAAPSRGIPADLRRTTAPVRPDEAAAPPVRRPDFQIKRTESAPAGEGAAVRDELRRDAPPADPQRQPEPLRQPEPPRPVVPQVEEAPLPEPADPLWPSYLTALKAGSLTTFALVAPYVQGLPKDGALELAYSGTRRWARQACTYAQFPETLVVLLATAEAVYGTPRINVGIAGEEAGWKRHGYPSLGEDLSSQPPAPPPGGPVGGSPLPSGNRPAAPSVNLPASAKTPARSKTGINDFLERKKGQAAAANNLDSGFDGDDPPPELPDLTDAGPPAHPRVDPEALDAAAERLEAQLDRAATVNPTSAATMQDVIDLFGGTLLPDGT